MTLRDRAFLGFVIFVAFVFVGVGVGYLLTTIYRPGGLFA